MFKHALLLTAAGALTISGCATRPTELNRFEFDVAEQICRVDALAEEKDSYLSITNDSKTSIAAFQNKYGSYDEERHTILMQKLLRYEAEVEASYRFVTQNCGAYMRCLERNKHDEQKCTRTESRWARSQQNFSNLAVQIRTIAAQVERERIRAKQRRKANRGRGDRGDECCGVVNSVFTDCCG